MKVKWTGFSILFLLIVGILCCTKESYAADAEQSGRPAGSGLSDIWKQKVANHYGSESEDSDETTLNPKNAPIQLTADDIERMNHGDVTMLFSEEGYLTFLRGRYYEEKVTNVEEGIESLLGMAELLGLTRGAEFFGVYSETNRYGYTYYIYKQRYGELTLQNAVLKIVVDPEGYTAGLICSFTPNIGFAPETQSSITPERAEEIVKNRYP